MTLDAVAEARRLPVIATVVLAFRRVLGQPRAFARIALLPGLIAFAVIYGLSQVPWSQNALSKSLIYVQCFSALAIPLGYLGLAWLRFSLLQARPRLLTPAPLGRDSLHAILYCLGCLLWLLATPSLMVAFFGFYGPLNVNWGGELTLAAAGLFLLTGFYLMGRLLLAVPAIAVGQARTPRAAWRLTRGNSLRLFGGVTLIMLSLLIASLAGMLAYSATKSWILSLFGYFFDPLIRYPGIPNIVQVTTALGLVVGTCVLAEFFALAYRRVNGWSDPQQGLVERFD